MRKVFLMLTYLNESEKISLKELGIETTKVRKASNGGLLIKIPGPEGTIQVDILASKLREIFQEKVKVARPVRKGELRIVGLDESVSVDEVVRVLAEMGECITMDVKIGNIRKMANGFGTVWTQCPLVVIKATGKMKIGWIVAKIKLLHARPTQCYRC